MVGNYIKHAVKVALRHILQWLLPLVAKRPRLRALLVWMLRCLPTWLAHAISRIVLGGVGPSVLANGSVRFLPENADWILRALSLSKPR